MNLWGEGGGATKMQNQEEWERKKMKLSNRSFEEKKKFHWILEGVCGLVSFTCQKLKE